MLYIKEKTTPLNYMGFLSGLTNLFSAPWSVTCQLTGQLGGTTYNESKTSSITSVNSASMHFASMESTPVIKLNYSGSSQVHQLGLHWDDQWKTSERNVDTVTMTRDFDNGVLTIDCLLDKS